MNYKDFLKDKKIAIIGLGPHGEMMSDVKFLLKNKVKLSLFDTRSEERMREFLLDLSVSGLEKCSFGKIKPEDLVSFDMIVLSPEISKKSNFLKKANEANVQIEFFDTLFFRLAPAITFIGVLGVYGKSTVSNLIYTVLKKAFSDNKEQGLFLIDPESENGSLVNLKKIKKDDIVIARIPENFISHYHNMHISPHIAVITSEVPFEILEFQTHNNFIIAIDQVVDAIKKKEGVFRAKMLRVRENQVPEDWNLSLKVSHYKENISLVIQTAELFRVPIEMVKKVSENFAGLRGRTEFVKKVKGIEYYNDATSISPDSALSAIRSISSNRNIILIIGGAYNGYDYTELVREISKYVYKVVFLPGSGTLGLRSQIEKIPEIEFVQILTLEDAVLETKYMAKKGDKIVFSPAFEAIGVDISRKSRSERFIKAVKEL